MIDTNISAPKDYTEIRSRSEQIKFNMLSDLQTGSLLRTLVTSRPKGSFLELGTGTGLSLSWIVEAMDNESTVISIDNNEEYLAIAKEFFGDDQRVTILCGDGAEWIISNQDKRFDLIFADTWAGKYNTLDETLNILKPGGIYLIDDMLPQPNWPEGHDKKAENLAEYLSSRKDLRLTKMNWSTGLIIITKRSDL